MIVCSECGERLVDEVDAGGVTVDGERFPFRRESDHIACDSCGMLHRVSAVRAAAAAQGDLAPEPEAVDGEPDEADQIIQAAIEQILEANPATHDRGSSEPGDA